MTMQDPYRPPASGLVEPQTRAIDLASRGARFWAAMLDSLVNLATTVPLMWAFGAFDGFPDIAPYSPLEEAGYGAMGVAMALAVNAWLVAQRGQTIGKLALGIRMVRSDHSALTLGRYAGLRTLPIFLVTLIPGVGLLLSIVDVLFIFGQDRRCAHDLIADTIVVTATSSAA